jgi:hypothetical protein
MHRKRLLLSFEFLEGNHVWFGFGEPSEEVLDPFVNVVYVEGGDFHGLASGATVQPLFQSYGHCIACFFSNRFSDVRPHG